MLETMYQAHGVGLAAQQVGEPLQLCVVDVRGADERPSKMWVEGEEVNPNDYMPMTLLNPVLRLVTPNETDVEGCLSFPELTGDVTRPERVKATFTQLDGTKFTFEASGLLSRAIQHEVDHLNGILFIDRMKPAVRGDLRGELVRMKRATEKKLKRSRGAAG
jgi:peptide deformylase